MEKWVDIEEFKGLYQVSDFGNVRSVERYINTRTYPSQLMRKYPHKVGNNIRGERVHLRNPKKSGQIQRSVAKLVLLSFIGEPPKNARQVIHIDGNPLNNALDNLKWDVDFTYGLPINEEARQYFDNYIVKVLRIIFYKHHKSFIDFRNGDFEDDMQNVSLLIFNVIDGLDLTKDKSDDDKKKHFYCFCRKKTKWYIDKTLKKELNRDKIQKIYTFSEYNAIIGDDYNLENEYGAVDTYSFNKDIDLVEFAKTHNLELEFVKREYNKIR